MTYIHFFLARSFVCIIYIVFITHSQRSQCSQRTTRLQGTTRPLAARNIIRSSVRLFICTIARLFGPFILYLLHVLNVRNVCNVHNVRNAHNVRNVQNVHSRQATQKDCLIARSRVLTRTRTFPQQQCQMLKFCQI